MYRKGSGLGTGVYGNNFGSITCTDVTSFGCRQLQSCALICLVNNILAVLVPFEDKDHCASLSHLSTLYPTYKTTTTVFLQTLIPYRVTSFLAQVKYLLGISYKKQDTLQGEWTQIINTLKVPGAFVWQEFVMGMAMVFFLIALKYIGNK